MNLLIVHPMEMLEDWLEWLDWLSVIREYGSINRGFD